MKGKRQIENRRRAYRHKENGAGVNVCEGGQDGCLLTRIIVCIVV